MLFGRRMPFTDLPIHRRILAMSSISGVVKLGYTDKKRWHDIALDRVDEIVSKGQLIVWPLDDRQVDQEQSQGELDLLLEKFDKAKKPCSVVQLNWHLLADPTHHAEAAKRYQLFDSLVLRSVATLERFWLSCYDGASCTYNDGIYCLVSIGSTHGDHFFSRYSDDLRQAPAPLRSTNAVAALFRTLADLLNANGELKNLRDLVVQWPMGPFLLDFDDEFERPTLGGVIAAAPELRNLYIGSCRKLIDEKNGQLAAAYMRNFNDFILQEPMTALKLQRLSIGWDLADRDVDAHRFFDSIVDLTAPKLRRIDFLSNKYVNEVQEYNRESGRYRLLPSVNTKDKWFGAGAARRQMTPGSERPNVQPTCTLKVYAEEKDGEVLMAVDGGLTCACWNSQKVVLDKLVRVKRECVTQPRHLRLVLTTVADRHVSVPFNTKNFDVFDMFSLVFDDVKRSDDGVIEGMPRKVASLDSVWRERVWKLEITRSIQAPDECWHGIGRLLEALPGVLRIYLPCNPPDHRGRRCQREWSVRVAAYIHQIERDGTWKFMGFGTKNDGWVGLFYERSPMGIERAYARHRLFGWHLTLKFVRVGVTHKRWLSERGLVKPKGVESRSLLH